MAKRKDSIALYEVIGKTRQVRAEAGLAIPAWMGRQRSGAAMRQAAPAPTVEGTEQAVPERIAVPTGAPSVWAEPMVSISAGRLRLSLNYLACVAAGVVLVLLLAAAFVFGRASVPYTQAGKGESGARASAGGQPAGTEIVREKGKYYLVVQGMGGKTPDLLADARAIERFCNAKGERVSINEYTKEPRQYIVLSAQGFDAIDSPEALRYVRAIEDLGKNYKAQGGRYDFRQSRDAGGRVKSWFIQWKQ